MGLLSSKMNKIKKIGENFTFEVYGNFETLNLKLKDDMKIEDIKNNKELGYIFYNILNETFTYLGYNGNIRSNINKSLDTYSRNFSLIKDDKLDYEDIQNKYIQSRILEKDTSFNPYNLFIINLEDRKDRKKEINEEFGEGGGLNAGYNVVEAVAKYANEQGKKGKEYGKDFVFKTTSYNEVMGDETVIFY